jgi:hypothetical protein
MLKTLKKSIKYTLIFASLVSLIISEERSTSFVRGVYGVIFGVVIGYRIYGFSGYSSLLTLGGLAFVFFLIQAYPLHGLAVIISTLTWVALLIGIMAWDRWSGYEDFLVFIVLVILSFCIVFVFVAIGLTENLIEKLEAYVYRKIITDSWSIRPLGGKQVGLISGMLSMAFMVGGGLVCAVMGKIPFVDLGINVGWLNLTFIGAYFGGLIGVFIGSLVEATLLLNSTSIKQSSPVQNPSATEGVVESTTARNTFSVILITSLTWLTLEILGSVVQWIVQGWLNQKLNWFK